MYSSHDFYEPIGDNLLQFHQIASLMRTERAVSEERAEMAEMKEMLKRVETHIERNISKAASRPDEARSLVRLDRIEPRNMKDSLQQASKVC